MESMLKKIRKENNLKQYEVAEKIGLSKRQYLKYENMQIKPNYKILKKLANLYNIEIKELIMRIM